MTKCCTPSHGSVDQEKRATTTNYRQYSALHYTWHYVKTYDELLSTKSVAIMPQLRRGVSIVKDKRARDKSIAVPRLGSLSSDSVVTQLLGTMILRFMNASPKRKSPTFCRDLTTTEPLYETAHFACVAIVGSDGRWNAHSTRRRR